MTPRDCRRIERGAAHLHALGARAFSEFLTEIGNEQACIGDILDRLDLWRGSLTPEMMRVTGAYRFVRNIFEVTAA